MADRLEEQRTLGATADYANDTASPAQTQAQVIDFHPPSPVVFEPVAAEAQRWYRANGKRIFDLLLIGLLAPFWAVVLGSIALMVLIADGRPIFHRSRRVGLNGQEFDILKFRTMRLNADAELSALLAADPALDEEFKEAFKLRSDPRVTRVGRVLRRLSLDELPQLLNVLVGDMSLIGPRPVLRSEIEEYYGASAQHVLRYRPGLTGLWQISGRSLLPYDIRVALDLKYAHGCCLKTDLMILLRTIPSVLKGVGAF